MKGAGQQRHPLGHGIFRRVPSRQPHGCRQQPVVAGGRGTWPDGSGARGCGSLLGTKRGDGCTALSTRETHWTACFHWGASRRVTSGSRRPTPSSQPPSQPSAGAPHRPVLSGGKPAPTPGGCGSECVRSLGVGGRGRGHPETRARPGPGPRRPLRQPVVALGSQGCRRGQRGSAGGIVLFLF